MNMGKKRLSPSGEDDSNDLPSKNGSMESLSTDILINIFLQKPAEFLHNNVGPVCKSWWNIIHDPCFIDSHLANSRSSSLIFQSIDRRDEQLIDTIELKINRGSWNKARIVNKQHREASPMIKASCNGLILTLSREDVLAVSNVITKQQLELPKLGPIFTDRWTAEFGFAYDHSTKKYKVVCTFVDSERLFRCAVHTLGSDSWRDIKMPCTNLINNLPPISTNDGVLHWMTRCNIRKISKSNESFKCHILSMKVNNEEFSITRDPPYIHIYDKYFSLAELGGSLSLLNYFLGNINVWVLEDFHGEVWQKKYRFLFNHKRAIGTHRVLACFNDGEVLIFINSCNQLFSYDLKLDRLKEVKAHLKHIKLLPDTKFLKAPFTHIDSLVTL